jgi:hypothetical protein
MNVFVVQLHVPEIQACFVRKKPAHAVVLLGNISKLDCFQVQSVRFQMAAKKMSIHVRAALLFVNHQIQESRLKNHSTLLDSIVILQQINARSMVSAQLLMVQLQTKGPVHAGLPTVQLGHFTVMP